MNAHFFDRIANLEREHASFAIATVVARQAPVSSHLGDRALVFADGHMEGFVGGSCSRDIVRRQALGAIRNRLPVLLQIRHDPRTAPAVATPEAALARDCGDDRAAAASSEREPAVPATERVVIPMSCSSEGAVDVYIEPRVPLRRLIVVGFTPVAEAVARMASELDYRVVRVVVDDEIRDLGMASGLQIVTLTALRSFLDALDAGEREAVVAVVASQGHYDELALEALQAYDVAFMGLLASRRRAATVIGVLAQQGVPAERLAMIRYPVGLDIGARSPGEVAVSILAEIIGNTPSSFGRIGTPATSGARRGLGGEVSVATTTAIDPVCKMEVDTATALYHLEHDAQKHYFCCSGCRASFASEPARYLAPSVPVPQ
jgi:xanthine dehydrogenase accessory factor